MAKRTSGWRAGTPSWKTCAKECRRKRRGRMGVNALPPNYNNDMDKLKYVGMVYYILRKDGAYAGVSMWSGAPNRPISFAVNDGTKRMENCKFLYQGAASSWPPMPKTPRNRPWN